MKYLNLTPVKLSLFLIIFLTFCGTGYGEISSESKGPTSAASAEIKTSSGGAWPMFHHDAQHTGQSSYNGPQNNTLKWSYTRSDINNGSSFESASLSLDGSTIYIVAAKTLLALSTASAQLTWSYSLGGGGATAVGSDGTVYAVGGTWLYAFTSSGTLKWTFAVGSQDQNVNIHGEPCIGSDGTIYIGSWDTYVYAVKPDGSLKWKYKTGGSIAPLASPTLSADGLTVYVGSGDANDVTDGTVYALNTSDGSLKWSKQIDSMRASGAVVGPDGTVYVSGGTSVFAFSPNGTQLWRSTMGTAGSLTPALASAGIIYSGTSSDGKLYALDATNGQTKWSYQTGQNPAYTSDIHNPQYGVLTAPVIGADNTVYVGAMDGKMHALKSDGTLLWTYSTSLHIAENCPVIGPDGTLYFSSTDGYFYAVNPNSGTTSPSHTLTAPSGTTVYRGSTYGPMVSNITNNASSSTSLNLWAGVYTPKGSWVDTVTASLTLTAGQTQSKSDIMRFIPLNADTGAYYFCEYLYDSSWKEIDDQCVSFTVSGQ
ncbi:MAG: PQQ-like beta-propeller repeat protein [Nitrospirae bacterium]|nr:PQQ-like beta-propeller repeat protein [Nitrospirota bacterium]